MARSLPPRRRPLAGPVLDRRRFLTLTSTGLAALSVGAAGGVAGAAGPGLGSGLPMSVGYLVGSDELPGFHALSWQPPFGGVDGEGSWLSTDPPWEVVPAESLPLGDQGLASSTVGIRVAGLYPAPDHRWLAAVDLDVLFPAPVEVGPDAMLPFAAWSLRDDGAADMAPPVRFVLPLEIDGGLDLRLRVVPGQRLAAAAGRSVVAAGHGASPEWRFATRFTVDWQRGVPRLQRGIYLLGLAPDTWRRPVELPGPGQPVRWEQLSLIVSVEPVEDP